MRISITIFIFLFACGFSCGEYPNKNEPLTGIQSDEGKKTITPEERLAGIKLEDVYQGFISYTKDVKDKYRKGELEQPDNHSPDPNEIFVKGFGWINPKSLDWYLTLQPVELRWDSALFLIVIMEEDVKAKVKDPPKWWINMGWEGTSWVPQVGPLPIYSNVWPDKLPADSLPEENYDPSFDGVKWNYTWPHELLPSTFNNAEIISSPIEPNVNNKGRTKSNWGKPVVIRTEENTEIELICTKYQKSLSLNVSLILWGDFKQINIDGKKVWIGHYKNEKEEYTAIHFFIGDVLYQIKQNGEYNQNDCYNIIQQITEFMQPTVKKPTDERIDINTPTGKQVKVVPAMSPEKVNAQIASLRKFIIPPKGVSKADVGAVFGVPEVINELTGKGSAYMYPMHIYQLLDPKPKQEFRAYLQVTYENDKAKFISISHYCVTNSRVIYPQGSPLHIKQQREIERENRVVLEDLIEIKKNYGSELEDASWNNITSEQLLP